MATDERRPRSGPPIDCLRTLATFRLVETVRSSRPTLVEMASSSRGSCETAAPTRVSASPAPYWGAVSISRAPSPCAVRHDVGRRVVVDHDADLAEHVAQWHGADAKPAGPQARTARSRPFRLRRWWCPPPMNPSRCCPLGAHPCCVRLAGMLHCLRRVHLRPATARRYQKSEVITGFCASSSCCVGCSSNARHCGVARPCGTAAGRAATDCHRRPARRHQPDRDRPSVRGAPSVIISRIRSDGRPRRRTGCWSTARRSSSRSVMVVVDMRSVRRCMRPAPRPCLAHRLRPDAERSRSSPSWPSCHLSDCCAWRCPWKSVAGSSGSRGRGRPGARRNPVTVRAIGIGPSRLGLRGLHGRSRCSWRSPRWESPSGLRSSALGVSLELRGEPSIPRGSGRIRGLCRAARGAASSAGSYSTPPAIRAPRLVGRDSRRPLCRHVPRQRRR